MICHKLDSINSEKIRFILVVSGGINKGGFSSWLLFRSSFLKGRMYLKGKFFRGDFFSKNDQSPAFLIEKLTCPFHAV